MFGRRPKTLFDSSNNNRPAWMGRNRQDECPAEPVHVAYSPAPPSILRDVDGGVSMSGSSYGSGSTFDGLPPSSPPPDEAPVVDLGQLMNEEATDRNVSWSKTGTTHALDKKKVRFNDNMKQRLPEGLSLSFLLGYESMIRSQDTEDSATSTHLRPLFDRIRFLGGDLHVDCEKCDTDGASILMEGDDDRSTATFGTYSRTNAEKERDALAYLTSYVSRADPDDGTILTYTALKKALRIVSTEGDEITLDRQLMLMLQTIVQACDEIDNDEDRSQKSASGFTSGLTYPEFLHAYKTIVSAMQTMQRFPSSSAPASSDSDETISREARRALTRGRAQEMVKSYGPSGATLIGIGFCQNNGIQSKGRHWSATVGMIALLVAGAGALSAAYVHFDGEAQSSSQNTIPTVPNEVSVDYFVPGPIQRTEDTPSDVYIEISRYSPIRPASSKAKKFTKRRNVASLAYTSCRYELNALRKELKTIKGIKTFDTGSSQGGSYCVNSFTVEDKLPTQSVVRQSKGWHVHLWQKIASAIPKNLLSALGGAAFALSSNLVVGGTILTNTPFIIIAGMTGIAALAFVAHASACRLKHDTFCMSQMARGT